MTLTPIVHLLGQLKALARQELDRDVIHFYERRGTGSDQFDALCSGNVAFEIEELRPGVFFCGACLRRKRVRDITTER